MKDWANFIKLHYLSRHKGIFTGWRSEKFIAYTKISKVHMVSLKKSTDLKNSVRKVRDQTMQWEMGK